MFKWTNSSRRWMCSVKDPVLILNCIVINLLSFRDACTCYDHFFFSVFKLVLPPIMLKLSVDKKQFLDVFEAEEMYDIIRDTLRNTGVDDLIHLIADESNRQQIEPNEQDRPGRRKADKYGVQILKIQSYWNLCTFSLSLICINVYADIGVGMLTFIRNLYRIKRVPTIEDVQVNFESEFNLTLDALYEPV